MNEGIDVKGVSEDSKLEQLRLHAARIRASEFVGARSGQMLRLFDFFVECAATGRVPKEIEVAVEVFGRATDFDAAQDAMVRVYIHKLRRRLEEYYAGAGRDEQVRLAIPKGEYRLELEQAAVPEPPTTPQPSAEPESQQLVRTGTPRPWLPWALASLGLLLLANLAWLLYLPPRPPSYREILQVRRSQIWSGLVNNGLPVYVAIGDYYIFGELNPNAIEVKRLVREFNINSRSDLDQYLMNNPQMADRYMDVGLQYLPISAAYELRSVLPLLDPEQGQVKVVLASELTPDILKSANVIYIGLISGMGFLRDLAFTPSRFRIGDSYDELIDRQTKQSYVSQATSATEGANQHGAMTYHDYGYFSTFNGPTGNRIVIIAGTRDVAAVHTAEAVTHPRGINELLGQAHAAVNFEALYSVEALDRKDLDGQLLTVAKIDPSRIWAGPMPTPPPGSAPANEQKPPTK